MMKMRRTTVMVVIAAALTAPAAYCGQSCEQISVGEAVRLALGHNPGIRQSVQDTRAADSRIIQARAGFMPSVTASAMYIFAHEVPQINIPANSFGPSFPPETINAKLDSTYEYNAGLNASWTLFAGGMLWNNYSASKELYRSASYTEQSTRLDTVYKVKAAYYNLLLAQDSVGVIRHSISLAEEQYRNAKSRFDAGSVSELDVLNAKVSLSNLRPQILSAENTIQLAELNLKNLIGVAFTGELCGDPDIALPGLPASVSDLQTGAEKNNPQIKAMDRQIEASKALRAASKGMFSPTLALTANYDWLTNNLSGAWMPVYQAALVLAVPLFSGGATVGRVREADANYDKLVSVKSQVKDNIAVAVQAAYSSALVAQEELKASEDTLATAQQAESTAEEQYRVGTAINSDVLNANVGLREAQLNYIKAKYSYLTALAQLDMIEGRMSY